MSPSKKKAAKPSKAAKAAGKKAGAKTKAAKPKAKPSKKAAAKKAAPKKSTAKKAAKKAAKSSAKAPAKKAAAKKAAAKSSAKPASKATPKATAKPATKLTTKAAPKSAAKASAKKASKAAAPSKAAKSKGKAAKDQSKSGKRARPRKPITPTGPRHPKLGFKWICFACDAKFYDLGKEEPLCPKCATDQRERPPEDAKPSSDSPKPKVVRPMAQLLDDEEQVVVRDEARPKNAPPTEKEMFDDAENEAEGMDIDDAETASDAQEPPEIDAL